jgi:anaerobic selenocysteine-containing dehydrogenase
VSTSRTSRAVTRRRFVKLVAAGSAALVAVPALAAPAKRRTPASKAKPTARSTAPVDVSRDVARAREGTKATVATIRAHRLPPGGDLSVVFSPLRTERKGR